MNHLPVAARNYYSKARTKQIPKVALLIRAANDLNRKIILGASSYSREQGGWDFFHPESAFDPLHSPPREPSLPKNWNGNGILFRATSDVIKREVLESKIPAVNVSWLGVKYDDLVNVTVDPVESGKRVGEYLCSKNFDSVGYVGGPEWLGYRNEFEHSVKQALNGKISEYQSFEFPEKIDYAKHLRPQLTKWLQQLPKPVCVVTRSMDQARVLVSLCFSLGIDVPNRVSIVSCEHDELSAALAPIPISSVNHNPFRIGFEAAKFLDALMSGRTLHQNTLKVAPVDVVERESSNALLVFDEFIQRVFGTIESRLSTGINSKTLAQSMDVSRRTLEKRLIRSVGKTPSQIIDEAKIRTAKQLLSDTDMLIDEIAIQVGFSSVTAFARFFKRNLEITPVQYRKS